MLDRQKKILIAVIKEYQRTGIPVSSQGLVERWQIKLSPATVRAEMLQLDEDGFLEQPHTSAGRIPTDKALRFFIDELQKWDLAESEQEQIYRRMEQLHSDSMKEIAQLLADCSRNIGFSGVFGQSMDFHGAGLRWLFEEPEIEKDSLKNILKYFDVFQEDFNKFFSWTNDNDKEQVEIFVGSENPIKYLRDYSLLVASFKKNNSRGVLGILGPKRMNYRKNKFVVEETRKRIKK